MADTSSRQRSKARAAEALELETNVLAATGQQQHAINGALRLLAVWAVRAARAQAQDPRPCDDTGTEGIEE
jgi:hypothetical protein